MGLRRGWKRVSLFRLIAVLVVMFVPVVLFSAVPYSFYERDSALLKVAFKTSGKRIVECDEKGRIKEMAQIYRKSIKEGKGAKINLSELAKCPPQRHPIRVRLEIDGKVVIDKEYQPGGVRHDLSSYVYEEIPLKSGSYGISIALWLKKGEEQPAYTFEKEVELESGTVAVIGFEPAEGGFVLY